MPALSPIGQSVEQRQTLAFQELSKPPTDEQTVLPPAQGRHWAVLTSHTRLGWEVALSSL
jgi:hypothetical protein